MRILHTFLAIVLCLVSVVAFAAAVNINTADSQALAENLSGVGPKKAQAIVDYRKAHGPFKSIDDLTNVKGIGQNIIDANRTNLEVGTPKK